MKFKKLKTLAIAAVLATAACGISVSAAAAQTAEVLLTDSVSVECEASGDAFTQDGLLYTELDDGTYEVGYDYTKSKPTGWVTIPSKVNGKVVSRIAEGGFYGCSGLTGITIPDSVTSAGANAFVGTALQNNQSGSVKYAGHIAVYFNSSATSVDIKSGTTVLADKLFEFADELKSVSLPSGMINLGNMTFDGCAKLADINIPSTVKVIGNGTFQGCKKLTKVTFPSGLTGIGSYAFANSGLKSAEIKKVTYIGKGAFENSKLTANSVTVGTGYIDIGGNAFSGTTFYTKLGDEKYVGKVFVGCDKSATSVSIKSGTRAIAGMAFAGCTKLSSVSIPTSVDSIGDDAFFNCSNLTSVTIPSGVEWIGEDAFRLCSSLRTVSLPSSLKSSGEGAFYGCNSLYNVSYAGSVNNWGQITAGDDYALPEAVPTFGKTPKTLSAVTSLRATNVTGTSVTLKWTKNKYASKYSIDMYKNDQWVTVGTVDGATTSFEVTGLEQLTKYNFRVYAYAHNVSSSAASLSTTTKMAAVKSAKGTAYSDSVKLTWKKNALADSYQVDIYKNGKWTKLKKLGDTNTYTATGLSSSTEYKFRIFAFKGSTSSVAAEVTAKTTPPPEAITGLTATVSANTVKFTWTKGANNQGAQIDVLKNGKWTKLGTTTGKTYTAKNLTGNTEYQFRIRGYSGNKYAPAVTVTATTGNVKPTAVKSLKATSASATSIKLSWKNNTTADSYQVDMYKNGKWTKLTKTTSTSYVVKGLTTGTSYQFRVYSLNGSKNSASAKITATAGSNVSAPVETAPMTVSTAPALSVSTVTVAPVNNTNTAVMATTSSNAPSSVSQTNKMMKGIDVSGWQGTIDFKAVKASGVDFVIIKAGEDTNTVSTWETNYKNAKEAGLMVGAYWFSYATTTTQAKKEAKAFISAMKGKQLDFPAYYDIERSEQFAKGKTTVSNLINAFCGQLEKSGYYAGVYCSTIWMTSHTTDEVKLSRPVWIADYRGGCYYESACGMWQYGTGKVSGVSGDCDVNWGYVDYSKYIKAQHLNGY